MYSFSCRRDLQYIFYNEHMLLFFSHSVWFRIFFKQVMVPLCHPEVQENKRKEKWIELGLQQCQLKKRLKRMPDKRKETIVKK